MTTRPLPARQHLQWSLLLDVLVEVRQYGQVLRTGIVEDVMPDSSALWLAADAEHPRQLFEVCQDHEVWVTPRELSGDLHFRMTTRQIFGFA
ncbi:hypothetical protein [Arthrobacter sp. Z4-13]